MIFFIILLVGSFSFYLTVAAKIARWEYNNLDNKDGAFKRSLWLGLTWPIQMFTVYKL